MPALKGTVPAVDTASVAGQNTLLLAAGSLGLLLQHWATNMGHTELAAFLEAVSTVFVSPTSSVACCALHVAHSFRIPVLTCAHKADKQGRLKSSST
jgi:hypothetical protein